MECDRKLMGWIFFAAVFILLPLWHVFNFESPGFSPVILGGLLIFGIIFLFALKKARQEKKEGYVLRDERTVLAHFKAGYYTFITTLLLGFGLMLYNMLLVGNHGFGPMLGRHVVVLFVVFMSVLYALLTWYFNSSGENV